MWWKVYADGSEYDIICARTANEAIAVARFLHGEGAIWTARAY
jgi:hypothetical protein